MDEQKVLVVEDAPKMKRVYVKNGDVMAHAKNGRGCTNCSSDAGLHIHVVRDENGNERRQPRLCPKTWQRFLKRFPHVVKRDEETKQFFYEVDDVEVTTLEEAGAKYAAGAAAMQKASEPEISQQ